MRRRFKISVDGREYDVAVTEIAEGPGNLYPDRGSMEAARPPAGLASPPASDPADPVVARRAPAAREAGPGDVVSPIAGVVVSIDVALGAAVEETTRVATLEAMKTKTFVNAGRTGTVSGIAVRAGDSIDAGQPILTVG